MYFSDPASLFFHFTFKAKERPNAIQLYAWIWVKCSYNCGSWSIFFQQTLSYDIHNHWSTLDQEHYWVVIKDWNLGNWLSCNDNVVLTVPQHVLNTSNSYILFYKKIQPLLNFCKEVMFFLTLSLGVTTPYINPVTVDGLGFFCFFFAFLLLLLLLLFSDEG